jgi:hypothetical protein
MNHTNRRNNNPDRITENIIHVKVKLLRTTVHNAMNNLVEVASPKVQNIAVELTDADDQLNRVSERMLLDDTPCAEERHWTPEESGYGFHGNEEGILGEVARV